MVAARASYVAANDDDGGEDDEEEEEEDDGGAAFFPNTRPTRRTQANELHDVISSLASPRARGRSSSGGKAPGP